MRELEETLEKFGRVLSIFSHIYEVWKVLDQLGTLRTISKFLDQIEWRSVCDLPGATGMSGFLDVSLGSTLFVGDVGTVTGTEKTTVRVPKGSEFGIMFNSCSHSKLQGPVYQKQTGTFRFVEVC